MVRWGNRRGQSKRLPCTAWTWLATLEGGGWSELKAEPVVIPACMGLDRGVWFHVDRGRARCRGQGRARARRWFTCWWSRPRTTTR